MNATCDERIESSLADLLDNIRAAGRSETAYDRFVLGWLEFTHRRDDDTQQPEIKIMFSWGGPSDWLILECLTDSRGQVLITGAVYHFADWFDHAERRIEGSNLALVREFFDPFTVGVEFPEIDFEAYYAAHPVEFETDDNDTLRTLYGAETLDEEEDPDEYDDYHSQVE